MTGVGGTDVTPEQEAVGLTTRRGERPWRHRGDPPGVTDAEILEDFRLALMSRFLDDREISLQKQSRVFFQISGAGHEALALGLARHLRPAYDWFFPYYRDRALVLALGVTPLEMLLQAVGSADDPASGGRQMPCHWGNKALNIVTQSSATASQCLPAVGCAEAGRYIVRNPGLAGCSARGDEITYVSLGEGATSEGEFWESLSSACTLHLPVLFVVADNGFAISVPSADQAPAPISELVRGFRGLSVAKVDGTDYFAVRAVARSLVARVRAGVGPALLHATVTRPYSHSSADTQSKYRSEEELAEELNRDPLRRMRASIIARSLATAEQLDAMSDEARREVADASRKALDARRPDPHSVRFHVVDLPAVDEAEEPSAATGSETVALGEAIRLALREGMGSDQRVRVFGEDVADAREQILAKVEGKGGVFGTTFGLQREFGLARCYNTPLAEADIVGRAVGQAIRGLRPVAEVQFFDYIWTAMQQIKTEAATIRWRSNGAFVCPLVIRVPIGGYLSGGAIWHSQSGESIFAHVPGLTVVMPSRASDAVGLLRSALAAEDPVLFLEHKHLLRQSYTKTVYPPPGYKVGFGRARVAEDGHDLTVVTWGATVEKSLQAVRSLDHVSARVLDLRSIVPWDKELVAESVALSGRVLVVHEDVLTCGFGAEVAAWIGENCFADLDAPVMRVGAADTHVAYEPGLEAAILPQVSTIAAAAQRLLDF
ncbi:MAG: alpha-ketoacid dehydrogenase subunit alpha/beta [Acidimicrobiales bacterium]